MLSALGVVAGSRESMIRPSAANPRGFWEHWGVVALNQKLFRTIGRHWADPGPLPERWWQRDAIGESSAAAADLLKELFGDAPLWLLKDPRLCRLLPAWRSAFEACGSAARYLLVVRHPAEAAASLAASQGIPETQGALLWLRHMLEAEQHTRGRPRVFVHYDAVLSDWRAVARAVGERLGVAWPIDPERAEVDAFLDAGLRHHRRATDSEAPSAAQGSLAVQVYEALRSACDQGELSPAGAEQLDAVGPRLSQADGVYAPLIRDLCRRAPPPNDLPERSAVWRRALGRLKRAFGAGAAP